MKLIIFIFDWYIMFMLAFCLFMDNGDVFFFLTIILAIITQIIAISEESKKEKMKRKKEDNNVQNPKIIENNLKD